MGMIIPLIAHKTQDEILDKEYKDYSEKIIELFGYMKGLYIEQLNKSQKSFQAVNQLYSMLDDNGKKLVDEYIDENFTYEKEEKTIARL